MNKIFILFLSLATYISAIEYDSNHDNTYWYYDEDSAAEGWFIGAVRSNLVYGDKLRFAISNKSCDQIPAMYFTFSSMKIAEIKKIDKGFNIETLEGTKIMLLAHIDEFEPFVINATINIAEEINDISSVFFIEFDDGMPRNFVSSKKNNPNEFIEVMMLEIPDFDPNYKYFDITQIKFRMGGLVNVWMHAHQLCLNSGKNE